MPIEQNFNKPDLDLVNLEPVEIDISNQDSVYIRLSIHEVGGNIVNTGSGTDAIFYQKWPADNGIDQLVIPTLQGITNTFLENPQQLTDYIQTDGQSSLFIKVNELFTYK